MAFMKTIFQKPHFIVYTIRSTNLYASRWSCEVVIITFGVPPFSYNLLPSKTLHGSSTYILALATNAIVEIISLGFGTITWFPSFVSHDS
jgi:hypothetical protein